MRRSAGMPDAPSLKPEEDPTELRECISPAHLQQHAVAKLMDQRSKAALGALTDGLGSFTATVPHASSGPGEASAVSVVLGPSVPRAPLCSAPVPAGSTLGSTPDCGHAALPPSDLEDAEAAATRQCLEAEHARLQHDCRELRTLFDGQLSRLRARRLEVVCGLSSLLGRVLVHHSELQLLKVRCNRFYHGGWVARLAPGTCLVARWLPVRTHGGQPAGLHALLATAYQHFHGRLEAAPSTQPQTQSQPSTPQPYQDFESRELALLGRRAEKWTELEELQEKLADVDRQLDGRQSDAAGIAEAQAAVLASFSSLVPDKHPFHEQLARVFTR